MEEQGNTWGENPRTSDRRKGGSRRGSLLRRIGRLHDSRLWEDLSGGVNTKFHKPLTGNSSRESQGDNKTTETTHTPTGLTMGLKSRGTEGVEHWKKR